MQKIVSQLTLVLALIFVLAFPALGKVQLFSRPLTMSLHVPFAGTVSVPLADATTDTVTLTGVLHLVLHVVPPDPILPTDPMRVRVNLEQVAGVGEDTSLRYLAVGADQVNFATVPPDPILPLDLSFSLVQLPDPTVPPDPISPPNPVLPLDVAVFLTLTEDGQWEATIGEMSVPAPD